MHGNLGITYLSLDDYQKKPVVGLEKDKPMEIFVMLTIHWVTIKKQLSIMKTI